MKLYNTLTRSKVEFCPRTAGQVSLYVCGPTVYNYIHIGNARTFLSFDVIRRYLTWRGFQVTFIQNITDVDDKIIKRAAEEGRTPAQVAEEYTQAFVSEMRALGVEDPTIRPKATESIGLMIALIERLITSNHAYVVDNGVYFSVRSFPDYGKLSGRRIDELEHGARIDVDEHKRDPLDFALWKSAKTGEPAWESPWGLGRPGWHIECSAMSEGELGLPFDIHGGGVDLIFPHHENEIAQSEAATGKPMANYWLHGGMLQTGGEKMSKSLGNFLLLNDLLDNYEVPVIRLLMLQTHYRSPIDFSDERLQDTKVTLERIQAFLDNATWLLTMADSADTTQSTVAKSPPPFQQLLTATEAARARFIAEMDDDFNTAGALAALFDLIRRGNSFLECLRGAALDTDGRAALTATSGTLLELLEVLGVVLQPVTATAADTDEEAEALLIQRVEARAAKDWARADALRDELDVRGYSIKDTAQGPRLVRK